METRGRRFLARILLSIAVSSALLVLVVGALVALERQGLVVLRHVPSVTVWLWWGDLDTIAIVNTEVTPGAFLLATDDDSSALRTAERIWIPARTIVLRRRRDGAWPYICPARVREFLDVQTDGSELPQFVARGSRVPLEWSPAAARFRTIKYRMKVEPGVSLVPGSGLTIGQAYGMPSDIDPSWRAVDFCREGAARVMLDIDATTPGPGVFSIWVMDLENGGCDIPKATPLFVHDADMTIVDDR